MERWASVLSLKGNITDIQGWGGNFRNCPPPHQDFWSCRRAESFSEGEPGRKSKFRTKRFQRISRHVLKPIRRCRSLSGSVFQRQKCPEMSPNRCTECAQIAAGGVGGAAKTRGHVGHCFDRSSTAIRSYWASLDTLDSYCDPLTTTTTVCVPKCPEIWMYRATCPEISPNPPKPQFEDIWGHLRTFGDIWGHLASVQRFRAFEDTTVAKSMKRNISAFQCTRACLQTHRHHIVTGIFISKSWKKTM